MDQKNLAMKESFNAKNNRYILKLFGEMNHEYINIEKDDILTISKTKIDTFEKKGQISKWQFNLDQIYSNDITFEELYENEIENNDYLHNFNKESQYRTITFIGDINDHLTEEPYKGFIEKCIKECLNDLNNKKLNEEDEYSLIPIVSFYEINKAYAIDYLKNITDINIYENKDKKNNNIISNPKINYYDDDIIINDINQVQISNDKEFISLLNLSKKNIDFYKFNKWNMISKDESITQIITLKLLKSTTNECYSKINFVLYKAYEILEENKIHGIANPPFNLYTKDNYNFFKAIKNKENYRLNYAIKYLRDTLVKGNNLFIIVLPCEYKYLLLVHDLLNNIKMRRLIVENILLSDDEEENTNQLGEIYKFENVSELNIDINDMNDNGSFQSFSKNNSIITNVSSAFDGKGKNIWNMSYYENKTTEVKNKRKEINYERLRKIDDKNNIIKLFDILDKLSLQDLK